MEAGTLGWVLLSALSVGCASASSDPVKPSPETTSEPAPADSTMAPEPTAAAEPVVVPDCADGDACLALAKKYATGDGVSQDAAVAKALGTKAVPLLEKACDSMTSAFACNTVAELHRAGDLVAKNAERAFVYYKRSCIDVGMPFACSPFAEMLIAGEGTAADPQAAFDAQVRGCAPGITDYCHEAGDVWRDGRGVPKDANKAKQLYEKGCMLHISSKKACAKTPSDCEMVGKPTSCERIGKKPG